MSPAAPTPLFRAFEAVVGREAAAPVPAPLLAYARRVIGAGRAVFAAEPCPRAALRRAEALCAAPRGAAARLLALVFDSWAGAPALALRGRGPRLLRFGAGTETLDVELERQADGRTRLRVALEPGRGVAAAWEVGGRARALPLDAHGAGEALLPVTRRAVRLVLRRGRAVVARTPPLPRR